MKNARVRLLRHGKLVDQFTITIEDDVESAEEVVGSDMIECDTVSAWHAMMVFEMALAMNDDLNQKQKYELIEEKVGITVDVAKLHEYDEDATYFDIFTTMYDNNLFSKKAIKNYLVDFYKYDELSEFHKTIINYIAN